jgi:hypothetical protein
MVSANSPGTVRSGVLITEGVLITTRIDESGIFGEYGHPVGMGDDRHTLDQNDEATCGIWIRASAESIQ